MMDGCFSRANNTTVAEADFLGETAHVAALSVELSSTNTEAAAESPSNDANKFVASPREPLEIEAKSLAGNESSYLVIDARTTGHASVCPSQITSTPNSTEQLPCAGSMNRETTAELGNVNDANIAVGSHQKLLRTEAQLLPASARSAFGVDPHNTDQSICCSSPVMNSRPNSTENASVVQPNGLTEFPTRSSTDSLSSIPSHGLPTLQGYHVLRSSTIQQQHLFLDAAKSGDNRRVQALVLERPDLINCQPAHRWSALHFAAFQGNASLVDILLAHGASLEARGRDGATPLDVAKPEVFDRLLAAAGDESSSGQEDVRASKDLINTLTLRSFVEGSMECEECHICLEEFVKDDQLRDLPCGHSFHAACIDNWLLEKSGSCPVCRASVINP